MFRRYLQLLLAPPTDGSGGGADTPVDGATGTDDGAAADTQDGGTDDGEAAGDHHAAGGGGDDDDDVDSDLPPEIRDDPKRLRTHLRRTQRQMGRVRPIAERFRDNATGQFMAPQQIDRILGRAQDMEELETFFAEHPDIVQQIVDRRRTGGRGSATRQEETFVDPFAKEDDLPWDTTTPEGKKFLELFRDNAKTSHELRQHIKKLEGQLGQVNQRDTARTLGSIEATWKSSTLTAAAKVPEGLREAFVTSVWRQFELAKRSGSLGKMRVQQVLERELKPYLRSVKGEQRRTAADAQGRAEHNSTIARPGNRTATSVADPKASNKVGTIRDARKSFFERIGMSPTSR